METRRRPKLDLQWARVRPEAGRCEGVGVAVAGAEPVVKSVSVLKYSGAVGLGSEPVMPVVLGSSREE